MNRSLMFGLTLFLCAIGIAILGEGRPAAAGHGWHSHHGWLGAARDAGCYGGCGGYYSAVVCGGVSDCGGAMDCSGRYDCGGAYSCAGARHYLLRRHVACHGWSSCAGVWDCGGCSGDSCGGCSGDSCGGWDGDSCGGYYGDSCGGWDGATEYDVVPGSDVVPVEPSPTPAEPAATQPTAARAPEADKVILAVEVPADAKVFINGLATRSTGERRQYFARVPSAEQAYQFDVRTEVLRDGQTLVQTESVRLRSGERTVLRWDSDRATVAESARGRQADQVALRGAR